MKNNFTLATSFLMKGYLYYMFSLKFVFLIAINYLIFYFQFIYERFDVGF